MKVIVGLGNPGRKYAGTRHNIGFEVVDALARRHGLSWESAPAEAVMAKWRAAGALLVKPLTFMNLSGYAVGDLLRYFKVDVSDLLVIVDEAQLELGRLRARPNGSAGGHNGLKSVIEQLGTDQFARLRIGVGRGGSQRDLADHVLATFDRDEQATVDDALERAAAAAELFAAEGIGPVMNRFNRKEDRDERTREDSAAEIRTEKQQKEPQEDGN
jgi:PTH1 family peptidyl-tRNA hydrolase